MTYSLVRESDGAGDSGPLSTLYWMENEEVKWEHNAKPRLGCSVRVGSITGRTFAMQDYWTTTPVTEILEETDTEVKFKTRSNSIYVWKIF